MKKDRLTKLEKYWVMYDVGNSAFVLLVATIMPIYFNALCDGAGIAEVDYLAYWGYAASISTLIVALSGPVLGTLADYKGLKKKMFGVSAMLGICALAALWIPSSWRMFLLLYIVAKVGYSSSLIFYDSMLADITTPDRMDKVSSHGYAWGYIGSCVPFLVSLVCVLFYDKLGMTISTAMIIAFVVNALWWLLCTLPILKNHKQVYYVEHEEGNMIINSFRRLGNSLKKIRQHRKIFLFLIAFFCYIDGVYTIIDMATAYGTALGLHTEGLLGALLVTQIVAFPSALICSSLAKKYNNAKLIEICIIAYTGIALFAIQLDQQWEFWVLAFCVGMFQGGVQALSRSYFAQIIPPENAGEFFGLFDICGKGAAFIGTALVSVIAQITGKMSTGISVIVVLFIIGLILFRQSQKVEA